jgi:hypothetical protein
MYKHLFNFWYQKTYSIHFLKLNMIAYNNSQIIQL